MLGFFSSARASRNSIVCVHRSSGLSLNWARAHRTVTNHHARGISGLNRRLDPIIDHEPCQPRRLTVCLDSPKSAWFDRNSDGRTGRRGEQMCCKLCCALTWHRAGVLGAPRRASTGTAPGKQMCCKLCCALMWHHTAGSAPHRGQHRAAGRHRAAPAPHRARSALTWHRTGTAPYRGTETR